MGVPPYPYTGGGTPPYPTPKNPLGTPWEPLQMGFRGKKTLKIVVRRRKYGHILPKLASF